MIKRTIFLMLVILIVTGCAKADPGATPTATAPILATNLPGIFPTLPAATAVSGASPTPFTSFTAKPAVDTLKVRVNPGYMFVALMLVNKTDTVTVLGTAPGHEWTFIKTEDGTEGWVFTQLLESSIDLKQIPLHEPKDVQFIKGRVTDANGTPISGVAFAAGVGVQDASSANTASTDANGEFYFFIPSNESGTWNVSYTAIACESNVWSDSSCSTYKTGYTGTVDPTTNSVTLPQSTPLNFTWK
jgi:SH3-like domain-containing protein